MKSLIEWPRGHERSWMTRYLRGFEHFLDSAPISNLTKFSVGRSRKGPAIRVWSILQFNSWRTWSLVTSAERWLGWHLERCQSTVAKFYPMGLSTIVQAFLSKKPVWMVWWVLCSLSYREWGPGVRQIGVKPTTGFTHLHPEPRLQAWFWKRLQPSWSSRALSLYGCLQHRWFFVAMRVSQHNNAFVFRPGCEPRQKRVDHAIRAGFLEC